MTFVNMKNTCTALVPFSDCSSTCPRVCVYARSFTENKIRLCDQMQSLLSDCRYAGLTVTTQYQELAKPHKFIRPALWKMLMDVRKGRVDVLAITELSRLSAQPWKLQLILRFLNHHRVRLYTTELDLVYNQYRVGLDGKKYIRRYV